MRPDELPSCYVADDPPAPGGLNFTRLERRENSIHLFQEGSMYRRKNRALLFFGLPSGGGGGVFFPSARRSTKRVNFRIIKEYRPIFRLKPI